MSDIADGANGYVARVLADYASGIMFSYSFWLFMGEHQRGKNHHTNSNNNKKKEKRKKRTKMWTIIELL